MNIAFCYESVLPARGGCETYIADLDRIMGRGDNLPVIAGLSQITRTMVDAGAATPEDVAGMLAPYLEIGYRHLVAEVLQHRLLELQRDPGVVEYQDALPVGHHRPTTAPPARMPPSAPRHRHLPTGLGSSQEMAFASRPGSAGTP